jgi:hypothetical protein
MFKQLYSISQRKSYIYITWIPQNFRSGHKGSAEVSRMKASDWTHYHILCINYDYRRLTLKDLGTYSQEFFYLHLRWGEGVGMCTYPWLQIALDTKFYMVTPSICDSKYGTSLMLLFWHFNL